MARRRSDATLLAPGETAADARVALRRTSDADLELIAGWYGEALATATGAADAGARLQGPEILAITLPDRDEPAGVLEFAIGEPAQGWLQVRFIAIERSLRGWGYGSEAMRLLEDLARRRAGGRRFWAHIRPANGLNVYFWLRLGYRPALPDDGLPHPADGLVMVYEAPA
ncbi:MAG TPA: GNAT family N-acetyltransferase [Dehalococcoidia bacterium]|nr:GNAT family N-acetyltransferase [Dehalococcoidia bacterium]